MGLLGDIVIYIVPFLIGLSVLIFVHELGHYIFARLNDVKVEAFSLGFGRELWGITDKRGTRWKISLLPFGGYVMMAGDKNAASAPDAEELASMSEEEFKETLYSKSALQKIAVFGGGALGNYIYGFLAVLVVFFFQGVPDSRLVVENVVVGSPAAEAGIAPGDIVEFIDGKKIESIQSLQNIIATSKSEELNIQIIRGGAPVNVAVIPRDMAVEGSDSPTTKRKMLGIVFAVYGQVKTKAGLWEAAKGAGDFCLRISSDVMHALMRLVSGSDGTKNLGGPVRIAQLFGDIFKSGDISKLIVFSAMLSVNLGFINLLPLPALDGGSILISVIELVIRRPVNRKLQEAIIYFGFILLIGFMLFVTFNDFLRLGVFESIKEFFMGLYR